MGKALLDTGQDSLETIRESRKAAHKYRDNFANFPACMMNYCKKGSVKHSVGKMSSLPKLMVIFYVVFSPSLLFLPLPLPSSFLLQKKKMQLRK